jgi:hypothetical protein
MVGKFGKDETQRIPKIISMYNSAGRRDPGRLQRDRKSNF